VSKQEQFALFRPYKFGMALITFSRKLERATRTSNVMLMQPMTKTMLVLLLKLIVFQLLMVQERVKCAITPTQTVLMALLASTLQL
jgi:hypothetical protein